MKLKMNGKGKVFVISLAAVIAACAGLIIQRTQEPQIYYTGSEFREAVDLLEMPMDEAVINSLENTPEANKSIPANTPEVDKSISEENLTANNENVTDDNTDLININTASAKELMSLKGIGEKLSQRIIDYRTENGGFNTIQDIMKVSGIGNKKFEDIKDKITV